MAEKISDSGRRRLLKALGRAGSAAAIATLLPRRWTTPLVDAISLPAHAQASGGYVVTVTGNPACGSSVPRIGTTAQLTITVTPNPGAGEDIMEEILCDNNTFSGPVAAGQTDSNGVATVFVVLTPCQVGEEFRARYSYMGASDDCVYTLT